MANASNFFPVLIFANLVFLPVASLSYHYFEKRFLIYRRHYLLPPAAETAQLVTES